ncbi:MAG TPA: transglutaminase domain-containing protein [Patescibacteria group bacterium]|nr:transglutaminase domain-containing protein [Patescibacteria group bacterium]
MPELRERFLYPRAGWLSLGLLAVMALALAWSVQGAAWLEQMDYLVPLGIWAVVVGGLLGMLRTTIVATIPAGAVTGAALLIWMIGGEYYAAFDETTRLLALRADLLDWTASVVSTGYPPQMAPYAFGLGLLMWSTAFTAAYAVFRYHRVLDAILLMGAALIANMSATLTDLFGHLLLFVVAALLLWLRSSLVSRQDGWQRRRVNETLEVPPAIMRSGIIVAGLSVLLAWALTSVAVAAPLTGAWRNLDGVWTDFRDQVEGVFGGLTNSQARISGNTFGSAFVVEGDWVSNDAEVLRLAAQRPLYLRTTTYDEYNGRGWARREGPRRGVAAGDPLFPTLTSERPTVEEAHRPELITIEMLQAFGRHLFTGGAPLEIYAPSVIYEPNALPLLGGLEAPNALGAGESYEVLILVSEATEADLAAAGTEYPQAVRDLYLDTTGITDRVADLARDIVTEAGAEDPYERAKALETFFKGRDFAYSTDGLEIPRGADLVDTFLFGEDARRGYCQHYASAMVLMARSVGLPARVAVGFAPGESEGDDLWLVREANAHAWAEIYFPGHGWQIFEATKGISPRFTRASGDPAAPRRPAGPGIDPFLEPELPPNFYRGGVPIPSSEPVEGAIDPANPDEGAGVVDATRLGNAILMGTIVLLGVAMTWLQMRRNSRRWRLLPAGERAWRHLAAAAERAGIGPRPAETIYEYAGWLEDQLPEHGEPIRQVADGKVWQSYSGRKLNYGASKRLDQAWASLRLPLLGLAIRRRFRRLVRRDDAP